MIHHLWSWYRCWMVMVCPAKCSLETAVRASTHGHFMSGESALRGLCLSFLVRNEFCVEEFASKRARELQHASCICSLFSRIQSFIGECAGIENRTSECCWPTNPNSKQATNNTVQSTNALSARIPSIYPRPSVVSQYMMMSVSLDQQQHQWTSTQIKFTTTAVIDRAAGLGSLWCGSDGHPWFINITIIISISSAWVKTSMFHLALLNLDSPSPRRQITQIPISGQASANIWTFFAKSIKLKKVSNTSPLFDCVFVQLTRWLTDGLTFLCNPSAKGDLSLQVPISSNRKWIDPSCLSTFCFHHHRRLHRHRTKRRQETLNNRQRTTTSDEWTTTSFASSTLEDLDHLKTVLSTHKHVHLHDHISPSSRVIRLGKFVHSRSLASNEYVNQTCMHFDGASQCSNEPRVGYASSFYVHFTYLVRNEPRFGERVAVLCNKSWLLLLSSQNTHTRTQQEGNLNLNHWEICLCLLGRSKNSPFILQSSPASQTKMKCPLPSLYWQSECSLNPFSFFSVDHKLSFVRMLCGQFSKCSRSLARLLWFNNSHLIGWMNLVWFDWLLVVFALLVADGGFLKPWVVEWVREGESVTWALIAHLSWLRKANTTKAPL